MRLRRVWLLVLLVTLAAPAAAQTLPEGPVRVLDGRLLVGGEIVATIGDSDDIAFFNYTDYEHNVLRLFRVSLSGVWQPVSRIALVGEVRSEDLQQARAYAAYVRIRPWPERGLDIQVGRIPPAFGAFGRRNYAGDNILIGYPLAYQYLTSIRPDAIPATRADLLRMRARGWQSSYPVGDQTPEPGVPLISGFRWDTGVQAHWSTDTVELTGAVTTGTLSDPQLTDNNGGRQLSGRAAWKPATGFIIGTSAARGEWLDSDVERLLPDSHDYTQTAWGGDAEYSRDHWLVRGEVVWSRWRMPFAVTNPSGENIDALGMWVEGRYRITPRMFTAARVDHLGFSKIALANAVPIEWDAPVMRVEYDLGYYIQRNLVARVAVQYNDRPAGRVRTRTYFAGQLAYWF
jgi:hypothetical protein